MPFANILTGTGAWGGSEGSQKPAHASFTILTYVLSV
jgi:hypothetical protein